MRLYRNYHQQFYKIPPTIVTNTTDEMKIMNEEIFGPVLPVIEYDNLDDALSEAEDLVAGFIGINKKDS